MSNMEITDQSGAPKQPQQTMEQWHVSSLNGRESVISPQAAHSGFQLADIPRESYDRYPDHDDPTLRAFGSSSYVPNDPRAVVNPSPASNTCRPVHDHVVSDRIIYNVSGRVDC